MTIMQIPIPDDLKDAFEKAFPGETIEQAVERLLRAEVERRTTDADRAKDHAQAFQHIRDFAKDMNLSMSDDEFRAARAWSKWRANACWLLRANASRLTA